MWLLDGPCLFSRIGFSHPSSDLTRSAATVVHLISALHVSAVVPIFDSTPTDLVLLTSPSSREVAQAWSISLCCSVLQFALPPVQFWCRPPASVCFPCCYQVARTVRQSNFLSLLVSPSAISALFRCCSSEVDSLIVAG
jgi:hypothetical protein